MSLLPVGRHLIRSSNSLLQRLPMAREPSCRRFFFLQFGYIDTASSLLRVWHGRAVIFRVDEMDSHRVENISPDTELLIFILGNQMKCSSKYIRVRRIDTNRKVSFQITETVRCLVSMAMAVPKENPPGVVIIRCRTGTGSPKPIVLNPFLLVVHRT